MEPAEVYEATAKLSASDRPFGRLGLVRVDGFRLLDSGEGSVSGVMA